MTCLVTGFAGYVGSVLTPALLKAGYEVIGVDNFMYRQTPLLDWVAHPSLEIVRGDVRDAALMRALIGRADVIIPLACLTGQAACDRDPDAARGVIVEALGEMLKTAGGDQRIVYPNTNSGYGVGETDKLCTEESPLRPVSLYGRLKCEAEKMVMERGNAVCFRLATAFGMSQRMRLDLLVNDLTYRAVADGYLVLYEAGFRRNFIHVRDVARAFLHALGNWDGMADNIYNCGLSDANLTKRELAAVIAEVVEEKTGRGVAVFESDIARDADRRDYLVSNAKLEATGFKPRWSLRDGIGELVKGFKVVRRDGFSNA